LYIQNDRNVTHYATTFAPELARVAVSGGFLGYGFTMTIDTLTQYWALVIASVLGAAVMIFLVFRVFHDSTRGRLQAAVKHLRERQKAAQAASRVVDRAVAKLDRLQSRSESVSPSQVQGARDALEEARGFQKLVDDQVLVVRNNVRTVILEEYPPKRHAAMRHKYLAERT